MNKMPENAEPCLKNDQNDRKMSSNNIRTNGQNAGKCWENA